LLSRDRGVKGEKMRQAAAAAAAAEEEAAAAQFVQLGKKGFVTGNPYKYVGG
jgi:hypothetical protein